MARMAALALFLVLASTLSARENGSFRGVIVTPAHEDDGRGGALVMANVGTSPTVVGFVPEGEIVRLVPHMSTARYLYVVADGIKGFVRRDSVRILEPGSKSPRRRPLWRSRTFRDVPGDHWARGSVERLAESGLISDKNGRFAGRRSVNRYEMAVVLDRILQRIHKASNHLEERLEALESSPDVAPNGRRTTFGGLLSLAQTLKKVEGESERLRHTVRFLEDSVVRNGERIRRLEEGHPEGAVAQRVGNLERRLAAVERYLADDS